MKSSTLALIASALVAAAVTATPTAHAGPTVKQLCDAQSWPRPVPDVVGMLFEPVEKDIPAGTAGGALACWDDIRAVTADGRDASQGSGGWDTITAISPAPGTAVGRHDPITVRLAPIDHSAQSGLRPCDWVTTAEVAAVFGMPAPIETDGYVAPGSVEPRCTYRGPGRTAVESALYVTGAFPVDAAAEYSRYTGENISDTTGLGLAARCLTGLDGAQHRPYNEVVVLLGGNRLFVAEGLGAEPCEQLTQFARTAIDRL